MRPTRPSSFSAAIFVVLSLPVLAFADVVHLKDGTELTGMVKRSDDGWVVKSADKSVHIRGDQIESIDLAPTTSPSPAVATERLASLRHSVESVADLNDIIARFQRFIEQNSDATAITQAKKDLAIWQDRQQHKMVKVGPQWVLPGDRPRLIEQAGQSAESARQLMKQGRTREADPLLVSCLEIDPQNATALYLTGLLRNQQDQVPAARKAFEQTAALIPNHAPTLNNLGVVLMRQHQMIPALNNFDAAMLASPVNKIILDNVAVAFQTLPIDLQKSPITIKTLRHFNEQDQQLAERLASQGLHRYGSLWVADKDLEQMKQQEKAIQEKLDALAGDFDATKTRADQITQNIADNASQIHRIEADSFVTDPRAGTQIAVPYPSAYYDLQRDNEKMTREHDADLAKLDALKKQAQDLQNSRPSIKSQGVQIMIGVEGTPLRIPAP